MRNASNFLVGLLIWMGSLTAGAAETQVIWHGHATFEIHTPQGQVLMIDPWFNNPTNPQAGDDKNPLEAIDRVDYILLTHGHSDHIGDAVALGKQTGAQLVANYELGTNLAAVAGYPSDQMGFATLMNIGGEITIADSEVTVAMTRAIHSSGLAVSEPEAGQPKVVDGGSPAGLVIDIEGGPTLYHTGDTAYYSDMALIGKHYSPDVALINIGGHFGMEPPMAARAAEAVGASLAVPQHYGTFPVLTEGADGFVQAAKKRGVEVRVINPGDSLLFKGSEVQE